MLALPPALQASLEEHLGTCQACRQLVDELTDVGSLVAERPSAEPKSAHLQRAIQQLLEHSEAPATVVPAENEAASTARLTLLAPIDRQGFSGKLGMYQIRRLIGQGGMGIVFEAYDPLLKRTVAIKMLSMLTALNEEAKVRFLREAQAAAALTHENIVTIHAVDEDNGIPFLVLQYVAGESLAERLKREGRLPLGEAIRIGAQVARGLAAIHEKGLIHRDIKPSNILLEEMSDGAVSGKDERPGSGDPRPTRAQHGPTVKIADFGLVKNIGDEPLSASGTVAGTPEFMSPEQATGHAVDARTDLFSLGVVLYAASSGVSPFRSDSPLLTMDRVRETKPRPLQEVEPTLPDWFCRLVHRLMAKGPGLRIQSARELAKLLEQSQAGPPIPPPRPLMSRRLLALTASLLVIAGLAVALGIYYGRGESNGGPDKRPEPAPAKKPAAGFMIAGRRDVHQDLANALMAASDNDVIEVYGNGPYRTVPLNIAGKRLTIRAMAESRPVFRSKSPGARAQEPFLQTDADLRLEGLTIHWSIEAPLGKSEANMLARCIVVSTGGQVALAHCRIVAGQMDVCVGASTGNLELDHCHFAGEKAVGAYWRPVAGAHLTADNCVFEGRIGLSVATRAETARSASASLVLTHNTWVVDKSIQLMMFLGTKQPLELTTRGNLFDNTQHCSLIGVMVSKKIEPTPDKLIGLVRSFINWTESGNLHRRGAEYLSAQRPTGVGASAEIASVAGWLKLWKLPPEHSVEGDIRFHQRDGKSAILPPRLERVDNESGPVPAKVGADPDRVGPGAAHHSQ
ncbi:MAG: serine/threonine protein kinase [Gemmataceae bacterium]|nr:serine/threonine protein kinase [Gemmataceae bacterium]